jgi:hypothetical protein
MVAFSYNLSVADDYKGYVFIIDDKGVSFVIDNQSNDFSFTDIHVICPFVESICITFNRVVAPEGWKVVELDDEILAINTSIYKRFIRRLNIILNARKYPDPENLHHFDENWKEAVLDVVSKECK